MHVKLKIISQQYTLLSIAMVVKRLESKKLFGYINKSESNEIHSEAQNLMSFPGSINLASDT